MSTIRLDPVMSDYLLRSCSPVDPVVTSLIARTAELGEMFGMMTPVEQSGLMTMLARLMSARTVVDIGTFTGLSALSFARGIVPGGRVITCDVTEEYIGIAREHWRLDGVEDRIEFRLGPARSTLRNLVGSVQADIVFVDADKMGYPAYVQAAIPLLRSGGLLILDNVLLEGATVDPDLAESEMQRFVAETMREVNASVAADDRLDVVMLPIADGVTIARKK